MAEKDVDEQFAAIMARWDDEALGHDPYGDPTADPQTPEPPEITRVSDLSDIADIPSLADRPDGVNPAPVTPPAPVPRSNDVGNRANSGSSDDGRPATEDGTTPEPDVMDGVDPDDVHYSPPPPAPLPPSEDKHFWTMMGALVAGPVLFLYLLLFNRDGNGWWMMFALLVSVIGFVLLVLRQPLERDEDDDGIRL